MKLYIHTRCYRFIYTYIYIYIYIYMSVTGPLLRKREVAAAAREIKVEGTQSH